ncbi:MAG TPA: response regulator transcription factor [Opitutaceae bacterium]|jgi:DNA-binding NarL/FixJ family response regulator|nr:response regulator transcription factor [Opitutaceae bacterium]
MKTISVLLAEDHAVVRQGLRSLLCAEADIEVVGEAEDGREAVAMAQQLLPSVIVMDLAMPNLNGVEAVRQIVSLGLPSKLLVLSSYSDDEYVEQLTEAGVSGYLVKQTAAADLLTAVREAAKGRTFYSPSISRRMRDDPRSTRTRGRPQPKKPEMTTRGREVLQLVAEGHPNRQIAAVLGISIKTVEKHRQHVMNSLGIHDIAGLTRYAVAHGIVENKGQAGLAATVDPGLAIA